MVRRMRPARSWREIARAVSAAGPARWTAARLARAVRRFVAEGLADPALLAAASRRPAPDRLVAVVAGMARARPGVSLRAMAAELTAMRERTPRGGTDWAVSSVAHLLDRARAAGMLNDVTPLLRPAE